MAITNPCGLSVQDVARIIKDNVLKGGYNGRSAVLNGLINDPSLNLTYSEAKQVTDYYFSIYRKIAAQNKTKPTIVHLNAEQKAQRQVNNLALDYLAGNTGGVPLTDADIEHLQSLYEKADKADTPSLKAVFDEQANVFIAKFMPTYKNELFRSSVYARPLLSAVFFIKSFTSNFWAQVERSISNTILDGKKADFRSLAKYNGLANASLGYTMGGGVPATTIAHNEQFDFSKGRLEEFDFKGSSLEHAGSGKKSYFGIMKFMTKWSNRFNAAPDTRGIYSNAERHMYQLLKEKYRDMLEDDGKTKKHTNDEATQLALKDMELDDIATSTQMAVDKFTELGLPLTNSKGKRTSEFKVAVQEYQRLKRDHTIWGKALELSKNDFWKKNMTVASQLGFGDYGLFGLKAQAFSKIKSAFESKTKKKVTSALQLYAFGFLNGAANFSEDAIERFPLYGAVKLIFLQVRKGKVSDQELMHDIARRQKDIIVKTFTTATFLAAAKMLESLICGDKKDKQSSADISSGRTAIGPCGIPVLMPPQMMVTYKIFNILNQATSNHEDFFDTAMNILPVMVQGNEMGLGGSIDRMATDGADWAAAVKAGNTIRAEEAKAKLTKTMVRSVADFANSFLPLPSRALNEAGTIAGRIQGKTQRQQELNFSIDSEGKPNNWLRTLGKMTVSSLGNVTGVSEVMIAGFGSNKPYAMDWQGRSVAQLRGSDIIGNGIQYNENDELLIDAGVQSPYISRTAKVEYKSTKTIEKSHLPNAIIEIDKNVRYLTDDEFYNVSKALSDFNKEYFEKNYSKIRANIDNGKKDLEKTAMETVFKRTKATAIKAVELGKTEPEQILKYVKAHWLTNRDIRVTETSY